jgi:DNA-binding CsgD family transcriptional regulator
MQTPNAVVQNSYIFDQEHAVLPRDSMEVNTLISGLYTAAHGRAEWGGVLGSLANYLDLWLVQIATVDMRTGTLLFTGYGGPGGTPASSLDYVRFYNTIDPRIPAILATPSDNWMLSHQHHDAAFVQNSRFYQEFLIPHGGGTMAGAKVLEVDNMQFLLAMVRAHNAPPLDPVKLPFMNQLKHHLGEAFRNMVHLRSTYAELDMAKGLLGQFEYPMLLVDELRGLWHHNAAAANVLAQGDLLRAQAGFLTCRRREDNEALTRALHALAFTKPAGSTQPVRQVLKLHSTEGAPCFAFISAVRPEQTMGAFGRASRALIVLHDPAQGRSTLDPFIVAECFDLTPAEARIAVQIADGANAKEIAQRGGAALPTVRTHIQRVMEKTGVSRQSDLILLLLNLPARAT